MLRLYASPCTPAGAPARPARCPISSLSRVTSHSSGTARHTRPLVLARPANAPSRGSVARRVAEAEASPPSEAADVHIDVNNDEDVDHSVRQCTAGLAAA
jgi:hypothetical protein